MDSDILLMDRRDRVCTLTLNRPEKRNSLSPDLLIRIYQALEELSATDDVRCVVIRGVGDRAFSSGFDIAALPTDVPPEVQGKLDDRNPVELVAQSIIDHPYPVVAMLNGYAFGAGCELAVCCDIRIAGDHIRMGLPPAKLGLVYPVGGIARFARILGFPNARELLLTGRYYSAARALEMGLVNYVLPGDELEAFTYEMAGEIAGNAPLALKGMKKILGLLAGAAKLPDGDLAEAERLVAEALESDDLKEGQTAFLEKRAPVFKGK